VSRLDQALSRDSECAEDACGRAVLQLRHRNHDVCSAGPLVQLGQLGRPLKGVAEGVRAPVETALGGRTCAGMTERNADVRMATPIRSTLRPMPVWDRDAALSHPVDFRLVSNTFVSMFFSESVLDATLDWLSSHDYDIRTAETSSWADEGDMHRDLATTLEFPAYYGNNLDALNDCMRDVAYAHYGVRAGATGLVLLLRNFDAFTSVLALTPCGGHLVREDVHHGKTASGVRS